MTTDVTRPFRLVAVALAVALAFPLALVAAQQPSTLGDHAAGFRLVHALDYSRTSGPRRDFAGQIQSGTIALPMEIGIWYPASASPTAASMVYGDYLLLHRVGRRGQAATRADRSAVLANLKFGRDISDAGAEKIYDERLAAVRNAAPVAGRFPVIIAAASISSAPLFEVIASHGYVVLSVESALPGFAGLQVTNTSLAIDSRIRDLEYAIAYTRTLSSVDQDRLGVLGVNFDGMAALLYQMKNMRAAAVVSIDGWEGKAGNVADVRGSPYYDPRRFRVPYFVVQQDEADPPPPLMHDSRIFDALKYGGGESAVIRGLSHDFLIGSGRFVPGVPAERRAGYDLLARHIVTVFDRAFRGTAPADSFARSPLVKEHRSRLALAPIPDAEEVERVAMDSGGAARLRGIYRAARSADSQVVLFSPATLNLFAFRKRRMQQSAESFTFLELGVEAFPRSADAHDNLGNGYLQSADTMRAVRSFEEALAVLTSDSLLTEGEKTESRSALQQKLRRLRP